VSVDYDQIATRYDTYRSAEEATSRRLLALALGRDPSEVPDAATRSILELGCGTGNVTQGLESCWPGGIVAVDKSRGMLERAQAKLTRTELVHADASSLPLADHRFAAVVGSFVLHHLDAAARRASWRELRRVLLPGSGLAFVTSSHAQIRSSYLTRWFPSVADVDCARFPDIDVLMAELSLAGFGSARTDELARPRPLGDASFIEKARSRYISTLELIPVAELEAGVNAMQAQLERDGHLGDVSWYATIVSASSAISRRRLSG
jgi:SAM-dependent methyltransferase